MGWKKMSREEEEWKGVKLWFFGFFSDSLNVHSLKTVVTNWLEVSLQGDYLGKLSQVSCHRGNIINKDKESTFTLYVFGGVFEHG